MAVLLYKALLWLAIAVLRVVDSIFDLFKILAGISNVSVEGQGEQSILQVFTGNQGIVNVFLYIMLIGIGVGAIFTMVSMAKNMVTGKKSQGKIFTQYAGSILSMLIAFTVLLMAVIAVSTVLGLVSNAFSIGGGVDDSNLGVGSKVMTALVNADDPENPGQKLPIDIHDGNISDVVDKIVGRFDTNTWTGWEILKEDEIEQNPIYNNGAWDAIKAFPYFTTLLAAGVLLWCSFSAVIGLIVRLFDIVFLQLAMPLSLACYPLDDGARFKLWKETMISKMVLAFGTVIAVNVYLLLIDPILKVELVNQSETLTNFFRVLLIVCGGFTISAGQMLFARLMGTDASEGRQMQQNFRSAIGGLGTSWGLAKGAGRLAFGRKPGTGAAGVAGAMAAGGTNILGRRGGLAGAAQSFGRGVGSFVFGNRYKSATNKMVDSIRGRASNVKTGWSQGGGLAGKVMTAGDEARKRRQEAKGNHEKVQALQQKIEQRRSKISGANEHVAEMKKQAEQAKLQRVIVVNDKEKREV